MVMYAVQALCDLRCPEAIHGLYVWCKEAAGRRLTWIKAAIDKASGKYVLSIICHRGYQSNHTYLYTVETH